MVAGPEATTKRDTVGIHWSQTLLTVLLTAVLAGLVFHAIDTQQDGEDVSAALSQLEADSGSLITAQELALDLYDAVDAWEEGAPFSSVGDSLGELDALLASSNDAGTPVADLVGPEFQDALEGLRPFITGPRPDPVAAYEPAEAFERRAVELSRKYEELLSPGNRVDILSATEHDERGVALVLLVVALALALGAITVLRSRAFYQSSRERLERDREELERASVLEFGEAEILAGIVGGDDVSDLISRVLDLAHQLTGRTFRFIRTNDDPSIDIPRVVATSSPAASGATSALGPHDSTGSEWPVRAAAGEQIGLLALCADGTAPQLDERADTVARRCADLLALIVDRAIAEQRLVHRANHDSLTGMPNRSRLLEVVGVELAEFQRTPDHEVALIFCDLDRFKLVNDSLGHRTGDELLQLVARRLSASVDGSGTSVFRLGGDEFVAVCTGVGAASRAVAQAGELADTLSSRFVIDEADLFVGASFGVAIADAQVRTPEELLRNADVAMYASKNDPVGSVTVYDEQLTIGRSEQLEIDAALRAALDDGGLEVYFQPLFDLATSTPGGVEALVRWNWRGRVVQPGEFLPTARAHGLMNQLGRVVIHQSLLALSSVRPELPNCSLWLNVDLVQLRDGEFPDLLASELDETGIRAEEVVLELNESDLLDLDDVTDTINRLREMGVRIAVDDFGTGYSTIVRLTEMPVDIVKLDRALVAGVSGDDPAAVGILSAAVALVTHAGLEVVVEGIETDSELAVVRELGCRTGQGFLFARPGPAADVLARMVPER